MNKNSHNTLLMFLNISLVDSIQIVSHVFHTISKKSSCKPIKNLYNIRTIFVSKTSKTKHISIYPMSPI
jgi:hypothetical protein